MSKDSYPIRPAYKIFIGFFIGCAILVLYVFIPEIPEPTVVSNDKVHIHRQMFFQHEHDDSELVKTLRENVRVFCFIMTSEENTMTRAVHVNATWGPRCNKHVFVTPKNDSDLPSLELNVTKGYQYLWEKTKAVYEYAYENELEDYDWFMKADDDTYVIVENLRFMLLAYDPNDPLYFGCKFKPFTRQGYMSGGAGYVLSRAAVKKFVEDGLTNPKNCKESGTGAEDAEMGKCLENVGVIAGDSRDAKGKHRMLPFSPLWHLKETQKDEMPDWFHLYMYYQYEQGEECCSDYFVSFHYIDQATMYAIHDFLYHIRAVGIVDVEQLKMLNYGKNKEIILKAAKSYAKSISMPINITEKNT